MNPDNENPSSEPGQGKPKPLDSGIPPGRKGPLSGLSADDLIILNEEIAGMARAGLPLDQGLAALAREMRRGRLQSVTAQIAADLQAGHTLPQALERQGERVPPFYAGLVAAGVRSGRIHEVLATLTVYARTLADLRSTVIGALFYPAVVMVIGFLLLGGAIYFLIPAFDQIFLDFKLKLPAITEIVLAVSRRPLTFLVLPLVGLVAAVFFLRLWLHRTPGGRRLWARLVYAIPIAGPLIRAARLAAFADLLGILVDHAVPLPEAFRLAGAASSDPFMADGARQVEHDLGQGQPLGEVMRRQKLVPELVAWMTGLGELRGTLGPTMHQVAEMYRRQAEMRAALLRTLLPPFLIIFTAGVLALLFVIAIFLPLMGLIEGLGGSSK